MRLLTLHLIPLSIHPQGFSRFLLQLLDTANYNTNPWIFRNILTAFWRLHPIRHPPNHISTLPRRRTTGPAGFQRFNPNKATTVAFVQVW